MTSLIDAPLTHYETSKSDSLDKPLIFIRNEPRIPTRRNGEEKESEDEREENLHGPCNVLGRDNNSRLLTTI